MLSLRSVIDVMILNDEIFFFQWPVKNCLIWNEHIKRFVMIKFAMLESSDILYDSRVFGNVARTGHHPRMFVSFNEKRYQRLKSKKERKRYAELFEIPIKEGKFDTSEADAADKLVNKIVMQQGNGGSF